MHLLNRSACLPLTHGHALIVTKIENWLRQRQVLEFIPNKANGRFQSPQRLCDNHSGDHRPWRPTNSPTGSGKGRDAMPSGPSTVVAHFAFQASNEDELSFAIGDTIEVSV